MDKIQAPENPLVETASGFLITTLKTFLDYDFAYF